LLCLLLAFCFLCFGGFSLLPGLLSYPGFGFSFVVPEALLDVGTKLR